MEKKLRLTLVSFHVRELAMPFPAAQTSEIEKDLRESQL
jgi:hypothetical protein